MAPIRISRSRLTACPACARHIRVAEQVQETACPFCGAELGEAIAEGRSALQRGVDAAAAGLSAGLVGVSLAAVAACTSPKVASVYGGPPPIERPAAVTKKIVDPVTNPPAKPNSDADAGTTDTAAKPAAKKPPPAPVPVYGIPPGG